MKPVEANTLIIELGRLTGHQQTELELPKKVVPFFGLSGDGDISLDMRLSNGALTSFRAIYRSNNKMWRIELTAEIPEIRAGVFPVVGGRRQRRSNYAASFIKLPAGSPSDYDLRLFQVDGDEYNDHMGKASAGGNKYRTKSTSLGHSRNCGWY